MTDDNVAPHSRTYLERQCRRPGFAYGPRRRPDRSRRWALLLPLILLALVALVTFDLGWF